MKTKLYIGSELADFNELFNVVFSIGDIRSPGDGNQNKTYTLNLPLTRTNKRLLKSYHQADVRSEQTAIGRLYLAELLIIQGQIKILDFGDYAIKIIIDSDEWMDPLKESKLSTLDLSAADHTLGASVAASWSATFPLYRYPLIDFGSVISAEMEAMANWLPNDFIPMLSITQLMAKILEPYTVNSAWMSSTYAKNLFILGREILAPDAFIQNKALEVSVTAAADNDQTNNITTGNSLDVTLSKSLEFKTETKDEANCFTTYDTYTVPETGTYNFKLDMTLRNTAYGNSNLTITAEAVIISILKNGTPIAQFTTAAYSGTELLHGKNFLLNSGFLHLVTGDVIRVYLSCHCNSTNIGAGTESVSIGTTTATAFQNTWSSVNRYPGLDKPINLEDYLPDITKLDFLTLIRDIFNLKFWFDKMKRAIYIEPWDNFVSGTVVDLTPFIDCEDMPGAPISPNYSKSNILKWKTDDGDVAFLQYLKTNVVGPGQKEVTFASIYAKQQIDYKEHPWSSIISAPSWFLQGTLAIPRIWNQDPVVPYIIYDRKAGFNTRIVEWKGLTAGMTWQYQGASQSTYPKIQGLDWTDIYNSFWQKHYHYADQGKLYTLRIKINPLLLNQFFTVVNTATDEGFRPTYQVTMKGIKNYFYLQRITSDGERAEVELIPKQ